jgi:hypothetical protein
MARSYNGWSASPRPADFGGLAAVSVAGETFSPGVRAGDVAVVFQYLAEQLHARVEPIVRADWHQADDWGYSYRENRNAANLSCHASGTAIDYNATRHPNGKRGTFTAAQRKTIEDILRDLRGTVEWGGHFTGTADEMHFEIAGNASQVADIARSIRDERARNSHPSAPAQSGGELSDGVLMKGDNGPKVGELQRKLATGYSAYRNESPVKRGVVLAVDNDFGDWTDAWVRLFQRKSGLTVDGIVGKATAGRLGFSL